MRSNCDTGLFIGGLLAVIVAGALALALGAIQNDIQRCMDGGVLQWENDIYLCVLARPEMVSARPESR